MAVEQGYTLGEKALRQIARLIAEHARQVRNHPQETGRWNGSQSRIEFYLGEALAAAGNPRTAWTTARAYIYGANTEGNLVYLDRQLVIANRYTGVTGAAGQYGVADWINGRWLAITLDCDVDGSWEAPEDLTIDAAPGPGD